jgi:hypothetical protein
MYLKGYGQEAVSHVPYSEEIFALHFYIEHR